MSVIEVFRAMCVSCSNTYILSYNMNVKDMKCPQCGSDNFIKKDSLFEAEEE